MTMNERNDLFLYDSRPHLEHEEEVHVTDEDSHQLHDAAP